MDLRFVVLQVYIAFQYHVIVAGSTFHFTIVRGMRVEVKFKTALRQYAMLLDKDTILRFFALTQTKGGQWHVTLCAMREESRTPQRGLRHSYWFFQMPALNQRAVSIQRVERYCQGYPPTSPE